MRKKTDNRGSSLIVVIIVIAFVSLLVATLFMMSVINIRMKTVDREAKENFYSAEGALEQITLGLQKELSKSSSDAYAWVMQQYAGNTLEVQRRELFNDKLLDDLMKTLKGTKEVGKYDEAVLRGYLSDDVSSHVDLDSTKEWELDDSDSDSLVLKGLEVAYTDDRGYLSVIETDIRLTAPNLNLIQPSDMPDVFEYSIIANKGLDASNSGIVNIEAGVYAGEDGLNLDSGAVWNFDKANRVIVNGEINIPGAASLSATSDMDLWTKEVNVKGGTLTSRGRAYVSNDLSLSNVGSTVTLEGEYYGYGNGAMLTNEGVILSAGGDSSAILINGTDSTLDMSDMRRLLLSGSAQIATGELAFDSEQIESMLPEKEPSIYENVKEASLSSSSYYIQSVANGLLVCSETGYLRARTDAKTEVLVNSPERLLLINNSDGTISLMDPNKETGKYITVKTEDWNRLVADADEIGVNEKFRLYAITQGNTNYYALKSYANGKFVSIDTYYPADSGDVSDVLCANRDKITSDAQLFRMQYWGPLPTVEEVIDIDPVVQFSHVNKGSVKISFSGPSWQNYNASSVCSATISYTQGGVEHNADMVLSASHWRGEYIIDGLKFEDVIEYTITYINADGSTGVWSGSYTHLYSAEEERLPEDLGLPDGVYVWYWEDKSSNKQYSEFSALKFCKDPSVVATDYLGSYELIHLLHNDDGTVSIQSSGLKKYVSVKEDGSIISDAEVIGDTEKFILHRGYDAEKDKVYYQLEVAQKGVGNGQYIYVQDAAWNPAILSKTNNDDRSRFYFDWRGFTDRVGEKAPEPEPEPKPEPVNYNPVTSMVYNDEDSAKVSFVSPYWTDGNVGEVTLFYEINGSATYTPIDMTVSGKEATCIVGNLQDGDEVTYRFEYTYNGNKDGKASGYVYIHETKYGDAIRVDGENTDIHLGESIEVKSNQIAYLVPPECIGVNNGKTLIGKNPMTDAEFTRLMSYANNTSKYPDFEIVSFTKEVTGLGGNLGAYRTEGEDGYQTIFAQSPNGTMVYFYVDFDADNTAKYFRDYYKENQSALEAYMSNYINEIRLSNHFTRLTTSGNMVYSANGSTGKINLQAGTSLSGAELSGLRNEEEGYQKRFKALSTKLMLDYDDLTLTEKSRNLFDNLIRYSETAGDADAVAFPTYTSYSAEGGATALVINNAGYAPFRYENDLDQNICLIIATGDVEVAQDFAGVIIARGTVTVDDSLVTTISGNQEDLYKVLRCKIDDTDPDSETILEHYFRDGEKYVLEDGTGAVVTDGDYISYADLITYEEWTKR